MIWELSLWSLLSLLKSLSFSVCCFVWWCFFFSVESIEEHLLRTHCNCFCLLWYSHFASVFTFISDYFWEISFLKCLCATGTTKWRAKLGLTKVHESILPVTRKQVRLGYSFVPNLLNSPQKREMLSNFVLLKSRTPQNFSLLSSVKFVIRKFQDFSLYDNLKRLNIVFLSKQQILSWTISSTKLMIQILKRSCVLFNISPKIPILKGRDTKYSIMQQNNSTQENYMEKWISFSTC